MAHCIFLYFGTGQFYPHHSGLFHWHLGQPYGCPSASEVTMKDVGKIDHMVATVPVKQA